MEVWAPSIKAKRDDDAFKRDVAVKIIRRGMNNEYILRRFRHERQALAALDHPNVARLLDGGLTDDGLPYFVMEFIDGKPIDVYCDDNCLDTKARLAHVPAGLRRRTGCA